MQAIKRSVGQPCAGSRGSAGCQPHAAAHPAPAGQPRLCIFSRTPATRCRLAIQRQHRGSSCIVASSSPDTEEQRSPLDAPMEWETPAPSKRPDIFPEFEKLDRVFLPKPLPGDPEVPDEELEESRKRTEPGDPDPEQKPGEPPEPEEAPEEPGQEPEKPGTDIPTNPE